MKRIIILILLIISSRLCIAQDVGSIKTEQYKAKFETDQSIEQVANYKDTIVIPIQLLKCGFTEEVYEMYPELKEKRVGLGVTNIVVEYLQMTNRFVFTEDKLEIKERMVQQFKASDKGFTENKIDGRGKITLAKYFVYVEVYDFSVSDDEVVKIKGEQKTTQTTTLGMQVKFVDAETGRFFVASGLGQANTVKTTSILDGLDDSDVKFRQSTIGTSTKKALESAASKIISQMIEKKLFKS